MTFFVLAAAATVAQIFPVKSPRNMMYHTSVVFLVAAALLLPPELIVLIPLVQTVPEWLKERYPWPIQGFNISNYTLNALAAWGAAELIQKHGAGVIANPDARFAIAGLAACVVFVAVNHVVVAIILKLGRGHTFRESGLFSAEGISVDLVLTILGVSLAAFWNWNPWLIFAALAPLVVVHRSLSVPQLQAEARVDPKTGLYNARYFATMLAAEIARAARFERPMSLIMADLDLLRDINNSYGHLAGDAVLKGIAEVFRQELRHYDVPARFGGEEFSILLRRRRPSRRWRSRSGFAARSRSGSSKWRPPRSRSARRCRSGSRDSRRTGSTPTSSSTRPTSPCTAASSRAATASSSASTEPLLLATERGAKLRAVVEDGEHVMPLPPAEPIEPAEERRDAQAAHAAWADLLPAFPAARRRRGFRQRDRHRCRRRRARLRPQHRLRRPARGPGARRRGAGAFVRARRGRGLAVGQRRRLARRRCALRLSRRFADGGHDRHRRLECAPQLVAHGRLQHRHDGDVVTRGRSVFTIWDGSGNGGRLVVAALGLVGGAAVLPRQHGLAQLRVRRRRSREPVGGLPRAVRLAPAALRRLRLHRLRDGHRLQAVGLYGLAVFAVPLLLMRKTQEAYLTHTQRSAQKLREAAETIQSQNVSLEQANKALRERSTAAMESLSATVDARDSYTAGHSRRVQQLSLAIGRELDLSQAELDLLGHAALFHDIGKLAIPDSILLKPASLTGEEWALMQRHSEEGARIIDRLGFLQDAVPAIRHHHERFDGNGYPDRIAGEEIPLGARIIHVADALDSMLTTRIYRAARPVDEALREVKNKAGSQFCPRCVAALERILPLDSVVGDLPSAERRERPALVRAASLLARTCGFSNLLYHYWHAPEASLPGGCRDRPGEARGVPGRDPQAVFGRADPRRAARLR